MIGGSTVSQSNSDNSAESRPLEDAAQQFRRLVENIPGIVVYMDLVQPDNPGSSIPLYISPQIEDLLGYPYAAWMNEDELWLDVLHPDDRERMVAADAEARRTLSSLFAEYRMVHRDGHVLWVSEKAAVVKDESSDAMYWQGVMVRDITERKQVEAALAASDRQFRLDLRRGGDRRDDDRPRRPDPRSEPTLEQVCEYPPGALNGRSLRGLSRAVRQDEPGAIRRARHGACGSLQPGTSRSAATTAH